MRRSRNAAKLDLEPLIEEGGPRDAVGSPTGNGVQDPEAGSRAEVKLLEAAVDHDRHCVSGRRETDDQGRIEQ